MEILLSLFLFFLCFCVSLLSCSFSALLAWDVVSFFNAPHASCPLVSAHVLCVFSFPFLAITMRSPIFFGKRQRNQQKHKRAKRGVEFVLSPPFCFAPRHFSFFVIFIAPGVFSFSFFLLPPPTHMLSAKSRQEPGAVAPDGALTSDKKQAKSKDVSLFLFFFP